VTGIGPFEEVSKNAIRVDLDEMKLRVLSLDALIRAKRAAARKKDLEAVIELEVIRQKLRDRGTQ
jgi:predicted nucleotidyltransferase